MKSIICFILILYSSTIFAYEVPKTFRGIAWGTDISTLPKEMKEVKEVKKEGNIRMFIRNGDKLKIGEAQLTSIYYGFYKDKFYSSIISFDGNTNFSSIKSTLIQTYGKSHQPNEYIEEYGWITKGKVFINLKFSEITGKGVLSHAYIPTIEKIKKDADSASKDGAKDL